MQRCRSFHVMQMPYAGSYLVYVCVHAYICVLGVILLGRGSSDSVLCALNSDTVTATSAEGLKYIDYRTFNLITYSTYSE